MTDDAEVGRARRRMAWERRLAKADANPAAVEWAANVSDELARYLREREEVRRRRWGR
ncbi:hypothetical protein [Nocardia sp. NPDC004722]